MRKTSILSLSLLVLGLGCSADRPRTAGMPSSSQDAGLVQDGGSTADLDASDSGETQDASELILDANRLDSGSASIDAALGNPDAGLSGFMCDPNFGAADACGGNATGTWKYREGCLDESIFGMLSAQCIGITRRNEVQVTSGFLSITSTLTYRRVLNDHYATDAEVPAICVQFVGGCGAIESSIGLVIPGSTASCVMTGSGTCDCRVEINKNISDQGSYTSPSAGMVRLTPDDGSETGEYHFCVDNGVFRYKGSTTTAIDHSVTYVLTP
jgi:hypothetical protein